MITKRVQVIFDVDVTVDETKFDDTFMEEFRESHYNFNDIDEHLEHLAQLYARFGNSRFIDGYGNPNNMGISCKIDDITTEIID